MTIFSGNLDIEYAQFYVMSQGSAFDGDLNATFAGQENGLCGAVSW